jgi:hypothetical protein
VEVLIRSLDERESPSTARARSSTLSLLRPTKMVWTRAKPPVLAVRGGCWFRGGDLEVHLGVESEFVPAKKAHPGMLVSGLHALAERLGRAGVAVTWDDGFPGFLRFYSADPFGNRLEFLERRVD